MFAIDLVTLARVRVAVAAVLLLDLATRAQDLAAHYTDEGIWPVALARHAAEDGAWSLHLIAQTSAGVAVLFGVQAVLAAALLVGFQTRVASVASYLLLLSLQARTPIVFYGFDLLLRAALVWLCVLPSGARAALDARRAPAPAHTHVLSVATAGFHVQLALIYLCAALLKLPEPAWRSLDAVWRMATTDHHATALGRAFAAWPDACRALTVVVVAVELAAPVVWLIPWRSSWPRRVVVVVLVGFHLATGALYTIGLFPLLGAALWAALWPTRPPPASDAVRVERGAAHNAVAGALLVLVLLGNALSAREYIDDAPVAPLLRATGTMQSWNMFRRIMRDGWFVVDVRDADGSIRAWPDGGPVVFARPDDPARAFPDMRWRKVWTMLVLPRAAYALPGVLDWVCREARRDPSLQEVDQVRLWFVEELHAPGRPPEVRPPALLGARACTPVGAPRAAR